MWISTIINYVTLLVILRFPFDSISFGEAKEGISLLKKGLV
jgi:hypothetical protein